MDKPELSPVKASENRLSFWLYLGLAIVAPLVPAILDLIQKAMDYTAAKSNNAAGAMAANATSTVAAVNPDQCFVPYIPVLLLTAFIYIMALFCASKDKTNGILILVSGVGLLGAWIIQMIFQLNGKSLPPLWDIGAVWFVMALLAYLHVEEKFYRHMWLSEPFPDWKQFYAEEQLERFPWWKKLTHRTSDNDESDEAPDLFNQEV
jgi:hypothetical protein